MKESSCWNRREFIKTALVVGGGSLVLSKIPENLYANNSEKKITILHTNDTHSRIEAFDNISSKYYGLGGVAARATMINKIRSEEKNVLLFDAGDIFQGSPYFNYFKGEVELKAMSEMKYTAATIGNHEFDLGIENIKDQLRFADFPFVISNYDFSNTPLENKTIKNLIVEKDDIKIGIYGLGIELQGLVSDHLFGNTKYIDPYLVSKEQQQYLKEEKTCDLIICLSHLGYDYESDKVSDVKIAKASEYLDLIIGGHTHTFMKKPAEINNINNKICRIFQVCWGGINLGRIDFIFDKKKALKTVNAFIGKVV